MGAETHPACPGSMKPVTLPSFPQREKGKKFSMKFLKLVSDVALLALAGLAVVTVAGFAGAWGWLFDLCAHFRPQYSLAALLLVILLLALERHRAALVAFIVLALNITPIAWLYLQAKPAATTAPEIK